MGRRLARPPTDYLRDWTNSIMSPAVRMSLRCLVSMAVAMIPGIAIAFIWRPAPGIGIAVALIVGWVSGVE